MGDDRDNKTFAPDRTPASPVVDDKQAKLDTLKAAITAAPWVAIIDKLPRAVGAATLDAFKAQVYDALFDRQLAGFPAMVAYLGADPALAAYAKAANDADVAVIRDREPTTTIVDRLKQLAAGYDPRATHATCLVAYAQLTIQGRKRLGHQPEVAAIPMSPGLAAEGGEREHALNAIKLLLTGKSELQPLDSPTVAPAGAAPDPLLDKTFKELRKQLMDLKPTATYGETQPLVEQMRTVDSRVIDRLKADPEASAKLNQLSKTNYGLVTNGDSLTRLYSLCVAHSASENFETIKLYLQERPDPADAKPGEVTTQGAVRRQVYDKLENFIKMMSGERQRDIQRLIARGSLVKQPIDILHEAAAGAGSTAKQAMQAAMTIAGTTGFGAIGADPIFRASLESPTLKEPVEFDGVKLSVHDFVMRSMGVTAKSTADKESNLPQDATNATGVTKELEPADWTKINALFGETIAELKPILLAWTGVNDNATKSCLCKFENRAAGMKDLLQRAKLQPGVELTKRCNEDPEIGSLRNRLHKGLDEDALQICERVLGMKIDAATAGKIGGEVHLVDDKKDQVTNPTGTDKDGKPLVPLAQAYREVLVDGVTISQLTQDAAQRMAVELDSWRFGSHVDLVLGIWNPYNAAFDKAKPAITTATGVTKLHAIELFQNQFATVPKGGDLLTKVKGCFSKQEQLTQITTAMELGQVKIDERAAEGKAEAPSDEKAFGPVAADLWAKLSDALVIAGAGVRQKLPLAGAAYDAGKALDAPKAAALVPGATPTAPAHGPAPFSAFYQKAYGILPQRHVVEVGRMMGYHNGITVDQAAEFLHIDKASIEGEQKADPATDETVKVLPSGFTRDQAKETAKHIWDQLHDNGDPVKIRVMIDGKRPDELDWIKAAFRQFSAGIDLLFYMKQSAELRARAGFGDNTRPTGGGGAHAAGAPAGNDAVSQKGDASNWAELADLTKTADVTIETRVRNAIASSNKNEIFRIADNATPAERKTILGNSQLIEQLRGLGQVDFDRVYAALTGTCDMATRMFSRSEGNVDGKWDRAFSSTDTEGMKADIKDYAARRKEFYTVEYEKQHQPPDDADIQAKVRKDVVAQYNNPDVRAVIESELSLMFRGGNQLNENGVAIKNQMLNGGEADATTKLTTAEFEWAGDILAAIRGLPVEQRQRYRTDPEFMIRLATELRGLKHQLAMLAIESDEPAGEDHIGRLIEISADLFQGEHRGLCAALSSAEYARLRKRPQLVTQICQPLTEDLKKTIADIVGMDLKLASQSIGATSTATQDKDKKDVPGASQLFALQNTPGVVPAAEVERLATSKLMAVEKLRMGAAKDWDLLLRQAVAVYKLDLKPQLQAPPASAEPLAPGAVPTAPTADALAKASTDYEHKLRGEVWREVEPVIGPLGVEQGLAKWDTKGGNFEDVLRHAVMRDPGGDPSSYLLDRHMHDFVGNDDEDIGKAITGASDDIVLQKWSSVVEPKFKATSGDGKSFKSVFDAYNASRADYAKKSATSATGVVEAKKLMDADALNFQHYVIEPSWFFEEIMLERSGSGDKDKTTHAGQQLERANPNYSKYRKQMNERIRAVKGEAVATSIGATGTDAAMVTSALRGALQTFSGTQEAYMDQRRDGRSAGGEQEGRELDRAFGDYKREVNKAEDDTHGMDATGKDKPKDIDGAEGRKLAGMDQNVNDMNATYVAARSEAAQMAATVVSVLVGVLLTAALPGAGSLLAMAMYGALVGAAAATGEAVTKRVMIGESNYQMTDEGARTIFTGAATGLIAAGSQFYAGKIMSSLAGAEANAAGQGLQVASAAKAPVPRWQGILQAGGKAGTTAGLISVGTGLSTAAGSALSPANWVNGFDEGWEKTLAKFFADLKAVPGSALRAFVTGAIGGMTGDVAHGGKEAENGDPLKPGERIGAKRVLTQMKNDFPANVGTAVADAAVGNALKENDSVKGFASQAGTSYASATRDMGLGIHDGSARYVEQQTQQHFNEFANNAEREMYVKAASEAAGTPPSVPEFLAARELMARQNPGLKDLAKDQQDRFCKWVREAGSQEEYRVRAQRSPAEVLASLGGVVKPTGPAAEAAAHVAAGEAERAKLAEAAGRALATEDVIAKLKSPRDPALTKQAVTSIEAEIGLGELSIAKLRQAVIDTQALLKKTDAAGDKAATAEVGKQYLAVSDLLKSGESSLLNLKLTLKAVQTSEHDAPALRKQAQQLYDEAIKKGGDKAVAENQRNDFLRMNGLEGDIPLSDKEPAKKETEPKPTDQKTTDQKSTEHKTMTPEQTAKKQLALAQLRQLDSGAYQAPREDMPHQLAKQQQLGGEVTSAGSDAEGRPMYEVKYPDGTSVHIVESLTTERPGLTGEPTAAEAKANQEAAKKAAEIQQRRDQQLTDLIKAQKTIVLDKVILGAGQSSTFDFATLKGPKGVPGVDITAIPPVICIAPGGSMFAAHGDFLIGQGPKELANPAMTRQPGEFAEDHGSRTKSSDFINALTMTGFETGMTTFKATAEAVEMNPRDGTWPHDTNLRVKCGDVYIYCNSCDSGLGLGAPKQLGRPGSKLAEVDATGQSNEAKMLAAGKLVHAQEHLALPGKADTVAVVGDGATGAWACESALKQGAKLVYWYGGKEKSAPSETVRAELAALGLTPEQINTYYRAYNERNAPLFKAIQEGRVILVNGMTDASVVEEGPNKGQVEVKGSGGPIFVDGVVSAIGSKPVLPEGMKPGQLFFKMEIRMVAGVERVTALIGVDKAGKEVGIKLCGSQMTSEGVRDMLVPGEVGKFDALLDSQTNDPTVPKDSRGVPGSIYQTAINADLSNNPEHGEKDKEKEKEPIKPVNRKAEGTPSLTGAAGADAARSGFSGPSTEIPYRPEMEQAFGQSFADVRAFFGPEAQAAATAIGARAYAVGNHIAFAEASPSKELVAHELAHVVQQRVGSAPAKVQSKKAISSSSDAHEKEADGAADAVARGGKVGPVGEKTSAEVSRIDAFDIMGIGIGGPAAQIIREGVKQSPHYQLIADIQQSIFGSAKYLPQAFIESMPDSREKWLEFMQVTAALVAAELGVGILAAMPEPTMVTKVAAIALQALIIVFLIKTSVDEGTEVVKYSRLWWNDVKTAHGEQGQVDMASQMFAHLGIHMIMAAMSAGALVGKGAHGIKKAGGGVAESRGPESSMKHPEAEKTSEPVGGAHSPTEPTTRGPKSTESAETAPSHGQALETEARQGLPKSVESVANGTVEMELHPRYSEIVGEANKRGFKIQNGDGAKVEILELRDERGKVLETKKTIYVKPKMRFLDLEHEFDHVLQLEKIGDPATERMVQLDNGAKRRPIGNESQGIVTTRQNSILEYHNRLKEMLRLIDKKAPADVLKEHAKGVNEWRINAEDAGLGRDESRINAFARDNFPEIKEWEHRYMREGFTFSRPPGPRW